jgi:hypothetical protein
MFDKFISIKLPCKCLSNPVIDFLTDTRTVSVFGHKFIVDRSSYWNGAIFCTAYKNPSNSTIRVKIPYNKIVTKVSSGTFILNLI